MIVFFADLDNTLIYSHKKPLPGEAEGVERYKGRQISFMTKKTLTGLERLMENTVFVPTTTRSVEQYQRILWKTAPVYALTCNGGILLIDGKIDQEWYEESRRIIKKSQEELERARSLLEKDQDVTLDIRFVGGLFVFTKSKDRPKTVDALCRNLDGSLADIRFLGEKVYVLPKGLDKGTALARFQRKIGGHVCWAAGDSDFDLPMLERADFAMGPKSLESSLRSARGQALFAPEDSVFSEFVVEMANQLLL